MLTKITGDVSTAQEKSANTSKVTGLMRLIATQLAIFGWLGTSLPSMAITIPTSYRNQYRACAGRLLSSGIAAEAAADVCAGALYPNDLARCVERIQRQTEIAAEDALTTCGAVRRPTEVASCVVGINRNEEQPVVAALNYCGRSLLPVRFAECVVGLRREIEFESTQAMETCIDASDRPGEFSTNFIPQTQIGPVQPGSIPTGTPTQTPTDGTAPVPVTPETQTPTDGTTPAPTTPTSPGGV